MEKSTSLFDIRNSRTLMKINERNNLKVCMEILEAHGCLAQRRNTGVRVDVTGSGNKRYTRFAMPGASDTYGVFPNGRHFELEIKAPGKKPSPEQLEWLWKWNEVCGTAFWVDDSAILQRILPILIKGGRIVYRSGSSGRWTEEYDVLT